MLGSNSVTFNAKTLSKINTLPFGAQYLYRDSTEQYQMTVRHSQNAKTGQDRHNIEVVHTVWAVDADTPEVVRKSYIVIELKPLDDSADLAAALAAFVTASTNTVLLELNDWKS